LIAQSIQYIIDRSTSVRQYYHYISGSIMRRSKLEQID